MQRNISNSIVAILVAIALGSCARKTVYIPVETKSENVQYIEKEVVRTIVDTVPVVIELPAQIVSVMTPDTISTISTEYAESTAMWSGGILCHTIRNKPVAIEKDVLVAHTESEKATELTDTVVISVPVYIDKSPDIWASFRLRAFWWLVLASAVMALYIFRRPMINFVRLKFK